MDSYQQYFILQCFSETQRRRVMSIYHLLSGKRTTSVMEHAQHYRLLDYFGCYPINKNAFLTVIKALESQGYLVIHEQEALLSSTGKGAFEAYFSHHEKPRHLTGSRFEKLAPLFYRRLIFAVQVLSEYGHNQVAYYPVEQDFAEQFWMKQWFKEHKQTKNLVHDFYQELEQLIDLLPEKQQYWLVEQFSGYQRNGLTRQQIMRKYQLTEAELQLLMLDQFHYLLQQLSLQSQQFSLMNSFIPQQSFKQKIHNKSAEKTYNMLLSGQSIQQIMASRQLKQSTIEEHIIELAMFVPDFPIESFISAEEQAAAQVLLAKYPDKRVKELMALAPNLRYFAIRMVQIKEGSR